MKSSTHHFFTVYSSYAQVLVAIQFAATFRLIIILIELGSGSRCTEYLSRFS